jgi:hypothetical protein
MPRHRKKVKTQIPWRRIGLISAVCAVVLVVIGVIAYFLSNTGTKNINQYGPVVNDYVGKLQDEGLLLASEVKPKDGGDSFIHILVPDTGEISQQVIHTFIELITYTSSVLESQDGFRHDDLVLAFQRPIIQRIIFVDRPGGLPDPIGLLSEATINASDDPTKVVSVINLSGYTKELGREYSNFWSVIQAVCLGYAIQTSAEADAICNVLSASGAAGYAGIDRATAEAWINGLGTTQLSYLGSKEIRYRFIDFVYSDFLR